MQHVGTFEAKNRLSELLARVENGEEITITRNGKPVARLTKIDDGEEKRARARKADEEIRKMRESLPKNTLEGTSIRELIEEGRRY